MKFIKLYTIATLMIGSLGVASAQINFFKGSFEEAMAQAKKEGKLLFVDFYADWCAPCKMMEEEVFSQAEVGDYYNKHFICCQLHAEAPENKNLVQQYKVNVLPTMLFIDTKGKVLRTLNSATPLPVFLHEAAIVTGEALSFEKLYEQVKKEKQNGELKRELLLQAPMFIPSQEGYNREKWVLRIESVFNDYLKSKGIEQMARPDDFTLLLMFHSQKEKNDPIFEGVVKHYPAFVEQVGKSEVDRYIVSLFNSYIISLCREGKIEYKQELERLNGDLKPVYENIPFGKLTAFEAINLLADGYYNLYRKNSDLFFDNINQYFEGAEGALTVNNYTGPIEDLFSLYQGQLPENAYSQVIPWLEKVLNFTTLSPQLRTRILCILGDSLKEIGDSAKSRQCFNQAFLVSAEIEHEQLRQQLQQMIQSKL